MLRRTYAAVLIAGVLVPSLTFAKDKNAPVPPDVLRARTVAVVIDPDAAVSLEDPQANRTAQKDVETAFANWGRYDPVISTQNADLIIVVKRGSGRIASGGVYDPRQGSRPGVINPTDSGINAGVQRGPRPPLGGTDASQSPEGSFGQGPHPEAQIGSVDDLFVVYRGNIDRPLDAPPLWRYQEKNALKPHSVPAVDAFRKAVSEAEQAAAKRP